MNTKNKTHEDCGIGFWVFFAALFAILLVSVLANLWIRVINNLAFHYFKLNQDSFWWSLLVALIITGFFIGYIFLVFDEDNGNALRTRIVGLNFGGSAVANVTNISPTSEQPDDNIHNIDDTNNIDPALD
jgi:hypothetical protein